MDKAPKKNPRLVSLCAHFPFQHFHQVDLTFVAQLFPPIVLLPKTTLFSRIGGTGSVLFLLIETGSLDWRLSFLRGLLSPCGKTNTLDGFQGDTQPLSVLQNEFDDMG